MITDIAGRVRNVQIPASKPLLPLFEAINNSIEAIEDAGEQDGNIEIEVIRDYALFSASESTTERQLADIDEFIISDNGIGFDEQNYDAFNIADTTSKVNRGGRGIGRFMWLEAFDSAEIDSVFFVDGQAKRRRFTFCKRNSGIENYSLEDVSESARRTVVRLKRFKEKYQKQCPKRLETISSYIVEDFLDIFIGPSCPKIMLKDRAIGQIIDLDIFYGKEMVSHSEQKQIDIKGESFDILHVRLYSTHFSEHRIYFCANNRVVMREKLSDIPNLIRRFEDKEGREFIYAVYVNSYALDSTVNADRTGFKMSEESSELLVNEITLPDIRKAIRKHCKEYLSPYTEPVSKKKRERIEHFVDTEGAMYSPIIRHLEYKFDTIEPDATDEEIDRDFYEAYIELQINLRKEGQELLQAAISDDDDFEVFKKRFDEFFEKISEVNRADLARYVCHRKAIIEFLKRQLTRQADGKYRLEERIHSIIFPQGKTSDNVLFEDHNLWLIDERLAFHVFLSSDLPIKHAEPLENKSGKEPDILVFDKAVTFSESPDVPFSSITIIEFKRPQRNEYSERENPFTQITTYIDKIKEGKAKLPDGRSLPIASNLPFYCYIVCDITPKLKDWARLSELEVTPDGLGFFGYKRNYGAYFEVISYSKLVSDAEKRNQAFFEKLGLPKRII